MKWATTVAIAQMVLIASWWLIYVSETQPSLGLPMWLCVMLQGVLLIGVFVSIWRGRRA